MRTPERTLAALLALSLLVGCGANGDPISDPTQSGTIAYVPLDDRPDNLERVEYLAESLGYVLELPDTDLYHTALDAQPRNANGTQCGDRAALYEWVLAREDAGCNLYLLSLDQLLSGGLVNSRHMGLGEPVTLSDGEVLTESELAERLLSTLAADENNRVWLLDTVMRLAPTMGYAGFDLDGYNALRSYGMAARPHLTGDALTVESIAADYRLDSDAQPLNVEAAAMLEDAVIEDYLSARERKLRLSDEVQARLSGDAFQEFRLLIGVDDSSAEDSIQKNEIAYLRQSLRSGDALLSGVDDLAFKALARLYLDQAENASCSVAVRYYGDMEDEAACAYDYQPLREIVDEHLAFFEMTKADRTALPDLQILVLTQPADVNKKAAYSQALIDQLNLNEENHSPTILIDAGNGLYGTAFHDALVAQCNLGWLLSYSGFLDMAIVTGTALSHGVARYAWLQSGNGDHAPSQQAFAKTLADSVIKDFCYKNTVREDLIAYIRSDLGGSPDNFCIPVIDQGAVQTALESGMAESTVTVLENFAGSTLLTSAAPYRLSDWGELTLSRYRFPWSRVFEIGMDIEIAPPRD